MAKENPLIKLSKDLKENNLDKLYLFFGEEVYLKELYTKKILQTIPDDGFEEFNKIIIDGKESDMFSVSEALESFPMMSDKKIVLIENSGIFKSANQETKDFYSKVFSALAEDTVLIFSETEVDKRSALFKAAQKSGSVVEFELLSEADLISFVQREVMGQGKKIQKDVAEYLVNISDSSLSSLKNEILKLVSNCEDEITKTDVDRLASKSLQIQVFELCDLLMERKTDRVLQMLEDLKTVKESPFKLIYILFGTFDKMLKAKLMEYEGTPYQDIAKELGVPPFIAKKYINGQKGFSQDELILMTVKVAEVDLLIKQGKTDEWSAFENYITDFLRYGKEN